MTSLQASRGVIEAGTGPHRRIGAALWVCAGLPALVMLGLMAMYFSGVPALENLMSAVDLAAAPQPSRREFGLLENIQNITLLAAAIIAARAAITHASTVVRCVMGVVALGVAFLLLEEIDYGLHWYELLTGVPPEQSAQVRNWHNGLGREVRLKSLSNAGVAAVFIAAPLAVWVLRPRNRWVRHFTPPPELALTLVIAFAARTLAHWLDDRGLGRGLEDSVSEFRETVMYYLGLLYVIYLRRPVGPAAGVDGAPIDAPGTKTPPAAGPGAEQTA